MLLKVKKHRTEEEVVELKLPAFFKESGFAGWYFMITEHATIIKVSPICKGACIVTATQDCSSHSGYLQDCMDAISINPYEFFKAWHLVMDHLEEEVRQPLLTK